MIAKKTQSPPIKLAELRRRCREASLSERELTDYFLPDEEHSKPFAPALKFNEDLVDVGRTRPNPEAISRFYAEATRAQTPLPKKPRRLTTTLRKAARIKLLAEGDSWFNLPDYIYPKTAIDFLGSDFDVSNIALWGDELEAMITAKQYRQPLRSGLFGHFLFSGGGNDVLGSIPAYVKPRKPGDTDPAHAADYIKTTFPQKISQMMGFYRTLANDARDATGGRVVLYVHGYANATPTKGGHYLGGPLEALGFDPVDHALLCRAIVARMVELFNLALQSFAQSTAHVVYNDLRSIMTQRDWYRDEIHPAEAGAKKIAKVFADAIRANTPIA
nr:SGNH/GDSL hydrolase family protein [Mesorhizobium loti]